MAVLRVRKHQFLGLLLLLSTEATSITARSLPALHLSSRALRPHIQPRSRKLLCCLPRDPLTRIEETEGEARIGHGGWFAQNVMQSVAGGPSTYAVMTVYFVQE